MAWNLIVPVPAQGDVEAAVMDAHAAARDQHPGASRESMIAIEPRARLLAKYAALIAKEVGQDVDLVVSVGGTDAVEAGYALAVDVRRQPAAADQLVPAVPVPG